MVQHQNRWIHGGQRGNAFGRFGANIFRQLRNDLLGHDAQPVRAAAEGSSRCEPFTQRGNVNRMNGIQEVSQLHRVTRARRVRGSYESPGGNDGQAPALHNRSDAARNSERKVREPIDQALNTTKFDP